MRNSTQFTAGLALATLIFAIPVTGHAQDTDATEETDTAAAENQPYVAEKNGDWELRCVRVEEGSEPCQLYQVLEDVQGGPVAEMVIFALPEGQQALAGAIVTTPLETLLTEEVAIAVDGGEGRKYPFSLCNPNGCVSRIALTQDNIDAFRKGSTATIRIVPARAPDQEVLLRLSLSGFTASFKALTDRSAN